MYYEILKTVSSAREANRRAKREREEESVAESPQANLNREIYEEMRGGTLSLFDAYQARKSPADKPLIEKYHTKSYAEGLKDYLKGGFIVPPEESDEPPLTFFGFYGQQAQAFRDAVIPDPIQEFGRERIQEPVLGFLKTNIQEPAGERILRAAENRPWADEIRGRELPEYEPEPGEETVMRAPGEEPLVSEYDAFNSEVSQLKKQVKKGDIDVTSEEYSQLLEQAKKEDDRAKGVLQRVLETADSYALGFLGGASGGMADPLADKEQNIVRMSEEIQAYADEIENTFNELSSLNPKQSERFINRHSDRLDYLIDEYNERANQLAIEHLSYLEMPGTDSDTARQVGNYAGIVSILLLANKLFTPLSKKATAGLKKRAAYDNEWSRILAEKPWIGDALPRAARSGPAFASQSAIRELSKQAREEDPDFTKFAKKTGIGASRGVFASIPGAYFAGKKAPWAPELIERDGEAIRNVIRKAVKSSDSLYAPIAQGVNFGGHAALDILVEEGEITQGDALEILIAAGAGAVFEGISSHKLKDVYKNNQMGRFHSYINKKQLHAKNPNLPKSEIELLSNIEAVAGLKINTGKSIYHKKFNELQKLKREGAPSHKIQKVLNEMKQAQELVWTNQEIINNINTHYKFKKDVDYVIKDGEAVLIDKFTGRLKPDHQISGWEPGVNFKVKDGKVYSVGSYDTSKFNQWGGKSPHEPSQNPRPTKASLDDTPLLEKTEIRAELKEMGDMATAYEFGIKADQVLHEGKSVESTDIFSKGKSTEQKIADTMVGMEKNSIQKQSTAKALGKKVEGPTAEVVDKAPDTKTRNRFLTYDGPYEHVVELVPTEALASIREHDRGEEPLDEERYNRLKESIKEEGIKQPVIIEYAKEDGTALLIEGNHRLAIAEELGIEQIPARVVVGEKSTDDYVETPQKLTPEIVQENRPDVPSGHIPSDINPGAIGFDTTKPSELEREVESEYYRAVFDSEQSSQLNKLKDANTGEEIRITGYAGVTREGLDSGVRTVTKNLGQEYSQSKTADLTKVHETLHNPYVTENYETFLSELEQENPELANKTREFISSIQRHRNSFQGRLGEKAETMDTFSKIMRDYLEPQGYDGVVFTDDRFAEYHSFDAHKRSTKREHMGKARINDSIERLMQGNKKVNMPQDVEDQLRDQTSHEMVDQFASDSANAEDFSDYAEKLGMTPGELQREIVNRYDDNEVNVVFDDEYLKNKSQKNLEKALEDKFTAIKKIQDAGEGRWGWNDLEDHHKAAMISWDAVGNEGVPDQIVQEMDELYPEGVDREVGKPEFNVDNLDLYKTQNRFETRLNFDLDPDVAADKITEILNLATPTDVNVRYNPEIGAYGKFIFRSEHGHIELRDMTSIFTFAHEAMHAYDYFVLGKDYTGPKAKRDISELIGLEPTGNYAFIESLHERINATPEMEELLMDEMKAVTYLARPFKDAHMKTMEGLISRSPRRFGIPELFADWGAVYLADRDLAMTLAPNFTTGMEELLGERDDIEADLNTIREKFDEIPEDSIVPLYKAPEESYKEVKAIFDIAKDRDGGMLGNLVDMVKETPPFRKGKNILWKYLLTPSTLGLEHEPIREIYRNTTDFSVYEANRLQSRITEILDHDKFKEMTKEGKSKSLERVAEILYHGNTKSVQKYFTEEELKGIHKGLTDEEVEIYMQFKEVLEEIGQAKIESLKYRLGYYDADPDSQVEMDKQIEDMVKRLGGWVPLTRPNFKFAVSAEGLKEGVTKEDLRKRLKEAGFLRFKEGKLFRRFESRKKANEFKKTLEKMGYEEVNMFRPSNIKHGTYKSFSPEMSISELMQLAQAAGISTDSEAIKALKKELNRLKQEEGDWDRDLFSRDWVAGIDRSWENLYATVLKTVNDASKEYGKMKGVYHSEKALKEIDRKKNPEVYHYAKNYIDNYYNSAPSETVSLRKGIYVYYLAFKFSYFVQNAFQRLLLTAPWATKFAPVKNTMKHMAGGQKDEIMTWKASKFGKEGIDDSNLSEEAKYVYKRGVEEKMISGVFAEEALGTRYNTRSKIENMLGSFSIVTDTSNRAQAAFTAVRIAKEEMGMTDKEEIYEFAKEFVEMTQVPYGPHNHPGVVSGAGKVKELASQPYIFKSFGWHDTQLGYHIMKSAPPRTKLSYGLIRIMLTGLKGIKPLVILNAIIATLTGWFGRGKRINIMHSLRRALTNISPDLANLIFDGAPSTYAGIDTTNMFAYGGIINPNFPLQDQMMGPGYSVIGDFGRAMEKLEEGDISGAMESFSLVSKKSFMRAHRWKEEGYEEIGRYVKIEPSNFEIAAQALSFTPARIETAYDFYGLLNEYERERNTIRRRTINEYKDKGEIPDYIFDRVDEHNEDSQDDVLLWEFSDELNIEPDDMNTLLNYLEIDNDLMNSWIEEAQEDIQKIELHQ